MRRTILDHTPDGLKRRISDLERGVADLHRMRNAPAGYVEPSQAFAATSRVRRSSDQSIPTGVHTLVSYNVEVVDELDVIDLSSSTTGLTIQQAGDYFIASNVQYASGGAGTLRELTITTNANVPADLGTRIAQEAGPATSGGITSFAVFTVARLEVGDVVESYVIHGNGSTLNLHGTAGGSEVSMSLAFFGS